MRNVILSLLLMLVTCTLQAQSYIRFDSDKNNRWADSILTTLTLEEKVGQLLMPRGNVSGKPHDVEKLKMWVKDYKIGGIVFFAGPPSVQARISNELQAISKIPLFIGEDFEWGLAMRLDSTDRFPYAMALGAMKGNDQLIEAMGQEVGRQCRRMGVHINYAPVVDVNNNIDNPVINFRSYGSDKEEVARKGMAYVKGLQSQNVIATAKHFPGHGDTRVDSHKDLPIIGHDSTRLHAVELYPFKKLIDSGVAGIMTAHLDVPVLAKQEGIAATFSKAIVTDLLRSQMNFKGLTFTDAMDMKGAIKNFGPDEAMVQAFLAGNDILETFEDVPVAVASLVNAVKDGRISDSLLTERVRKILIAKAWVGLNQYKPIDLQNLVADLNGANAVLLNTLFAEASITLAKNENDLLPIRDLTSKMAIVSVDGKAGNTFQKQCDKYTRLDFFSYLSTDSDSALLALIDTLSGYDQVIVAAHLKEIRPSAKYSLTNNNIKALGQFSLLPKAVLCIFGNVYAINKLNDIQNYKALILAYQQWKYSEEAAAQILFGGLPSKGKLPVTLNDSLPQDLGMLLAQSTRMSYGLPAQVGFDERLETRIDSIVMAGLEDRAYPGAVVQVVRHGKTVIHKAYGNKTFNKGALTLEKKIYEGGTKTDAMDYFGNEKQKEIGDSIIVNDDNAVSTNDYYDLASVTKVAASSLAIMQLMSEGKLRLDQSLGELVPSLKGTNKADLKMRDLLTHRAGLKAWIPFWHYAVDSLATIKNAVDAKPALLDKMMYTEKRPFFLWKIFGKKNKKVYDYTGSIKKDAALWQTCLETGPIVWKKDAISKQKSTHHTIELAQDVWLHERYRASLFKGIADSPVNPGQGYVYSDLHYYYYPEIVQRLSGKSFEKYLHDTYHSIGANSLCFNPLKNVPASDIVPTEYDSLFRQSLIHGRVHDEGAAIMGGISGHAGLFGTANDLAKLMQLYLNKGQYGGQRYFESSVIDECTAYQFPEEGNRRGIAFDKPDLKGGNNAPAKASPLSYGHSGFTGTYVWVDPAYDLIYIFLSNRVYPTRKNSKISQMNIRTSIGDAIYESIIK
ncbi:MAG: glycoside hydrolase family 3 N-terminal domain-containing protein [Saprospiraceae bacterium]